MCQVTLLSFDTEHLCCVFSKDSQIFSSCKLNNWKPRVLVRKPTAGYKEEGLVFKSVTDLVYYVRNACRVQIVKNIELCAENK